MIAAKMQPLTLLCSVLFNFYMGRDKSCEKFWICLIMGTHYKAGPVVPECCGVFTAARGDGCWQTLLSRSGWTGLWATWSSRRRPCSLHGGWTRWPWMVPSNPNNSMILWLPLVQEAEKSPSNKRPTGERDKNVSVKINCQTQRS